MDIGQTIKPIKNEGIVIGITDDDHVFITLINANGTILIRDRAFTKLMKDLYLAKYDSIKETIK